MPETAPDMGLGPVDYIRVTDPQIKPPRSWSIPAASMVDGLDEVKDEDALGPNGWPAPPNYDYKPGAKNGQKAATDKESN